MIYNFWLDRVFCVKCFRQHDDVAIKLFDQLVVKLRTLIVGRRLASKPRRMMRRFRKHPLGYTLSLPRAVASKPREVLGEVRLAIASRQSAEHEAELRLLTRGALVPLYMFRH